jgi:signal transduction histidine kinase
MASTVPGHIGLASMHERAALIDGRLEIETGERGTKVLVRAPYRPAPQNEARASRAE